MRGLKLKMCFQMFGWSGVRTWFRWSFTDPIQMWIWLNITHKPYCTYHGWHCKKRYEDDTTRGEYCVHNKLLTKKEIKKHWEEAHKEMERVESGKNGECVYCGNEKGTIKIPNPNMSELNQWLVCKTCKEVIRIQQELAFLSISKIDNPKRAEELNNRLLEISKQTGKPIMNAQIKKVGKKFKVSEDGVEEIGHEYESSSVIFDGEKDES